MDEQAYAAWKQQCRSQGRERRDALGEKGRALKSHAACEALAAWLGAEQQRDFLIYIPFRTELDTAPLIEWGWQHGWGVCVPRCIPEQRAMDLYRLRAWDELASGAYGIREPAPDKAEAYAGLPAVVIVPGLAFDRRGGRLGYGAGYYDRLRARYGAVEHAAANNATNVSRTAAQTAALNTLHGAADGKTRRALWIGIGFEAQIIPEVPMDRHDLRLDALVTEAGVQIIV